MSHIRPLTTPLAGIALAAILIVTLSGARPGATSDVSSAMGPGAALAVGAGAPLAVSAGAATGASLRPADGASVGTTACDAARSVQVSGAATINVVPDRVLVKLGVQTSGATPGGVLAENMVAIERVIAAVRGLGIAAEDVATDYYVVYPVPADYDSLTIKGYRLDNVVAVTLRDADLTGRVLVAALQAGANEVVDVQFYTSRLRRYRDEARAMALKAAREKAQALAEIGGEQAGCVLRIDESNTSYYTGSGWGWAGRDQAGWAQNVVQDAAPAANPTPDEGPVRLGRIAVRAEVNASFSLE